MALKPEDIQGSTVQDAADAIEAMMGGDEQEGLVEDTVEEVVEAEVEDTETEITEGGDEEAEETDEEIDEEADTKEEVEPEEAENAENTAPIESVEGLAEALDIPVDQLLSSIKHKVGDEDVPLSSIIEGHSLNNVRENTYKEILEGERTRSEEYTKQNVILANTMRSLEDFLVTNAQTPEMIALRSTDPAEWNARITEAGQKVNQLRVLQQQLGDSYEENRKKTQSEFLEAEGKKLISEIPGWGVDKLQESVAIMREIGFSDDEIAATADARFVRAAYNFSQLRAENKTLKEAAEKAKTIAKRVKKSVPKKSNLKPNAGAGAESKTGIDRKNVVSLKRRLAKSGNLQDAANVIEKMMS